MAATEIGLILLVACVVAMLSRRFRLPYSVGLAAAGIALSVGGVQLHIKLTPDLIYTVLLPPLIFEAALHMEWPAFRKVLPMTFTLASAGVLVSAVVVGVGMHFLVGWSWMASSLFGALIAATDPVAVIAAFKNAGADSKLRLVVESESLLNDGSAAVAFAILTQAAAGAELSYWFLIVSLLWSVVGGLLIGIGSAAALLALAGRTEDHLVEITLTTIAAYGSLLAAEHFKMSGILAAMAAGLVVRNVGWRGAISVNGRTHVLAFWEYAAFLANSVVFVLIGTQEATHAGRFLHLATVAAIALVLLGRAAAVYPISALFRRSGLRVSTFGQHVMFWGGLRGALALALALATPPALEERDQIIAVTFGVVAFSVFAQGLTIPHLIRSQKSRAES